jgi:hypothetical protein
VFQIHSQINIGHFGEACWVARNQRVDLFSASNNRLLKGYEYMAKFMLGNDVPWDNTIQPCTLGPFRKISQNSRGEFMDIYTPAYSHYVKHKGLPAPFTTQVVKVHPMESFDGTPDETHLRE